MPDIILYLLKANLSIVLFYFGYRCLLRKLTFYNLNRFYLLFALVFSISYPIINVKGWLVAQPKISSEIGLIIPDWQQIPTDTFSLWPYVTVLFWLGGGWFTLRLLARLGSLWSIHRRSIVANWRLFRYRQVFDNVLPFSFWRNIYLNIHSHGDDELSEIFEHEQIHVNELHTVDVLASEICSVICWFNPAAWLVRIAIRENLEFITDRRVLQSGVDKRTYQYSLLKVGQQAAVNSVLANSFNFNSLKRRIIMMNMRSSSRLQLGKYVFAIPVIAFFVLVFTLTKAYEQDSALIFTMAAADTESDQPAISRQDTAIERKEESTVLNEIDSIQVVGHSGADARNPDTPEVKISIRNSSSNDPLYVVDGESLAMDFDRSSMDPYDIASITVLKDASAIALYGERGVNGVILIITKKAVAKSTGNHQKRSGADSAAQKMVLPVTAEQRLPMDGTVRLDTVKTTKPQAIESNMFRIGRSDDQPLYLIDGQEASTEDLKKLSPDDISAVNVWKEESGIEKYGEKGANGVVEITTKKSQKNKK
ncbi:TonB-dependent receptor plug domain-containing protein [Parapedobacter deserti]|uniref:TonB-dependent receptor plug domain-containing protein n=1 Tax=Parapedobacter deserti TaxID=1912957 RepID=A0ABV7JIW5_9SPHI